VKNLLTPLVTIPGRVNFSSLKVTVRHSVFSYGQFLNDIISFVIIAAAVFFFVVRPVNTLMARRRTDVETESLTRECPECLSSIPIQARRCAFCTSEVGAAA
jgi:large conductance mechanosensitive channel